MEPMIGQIDGSIEVINIGNKNVSILAFMYDIMCLERNKTEIRRQMKRMITYLENVGMHIASDKCSMFQVSTKNKTRYVKNSELVINNQNIPYADPETALKYLEDQ